MRIVFGTWIEPWLLLPFTSINGVVIAIHHLRLHDLLRDYFILSVNISDPQFVETVNLSAPSQFNREYIFSIGFMSWGKEGLYHHPNLGLLRLLYHLTFKPTALCPLQSTSVVRSINKSSCIGSAFKPGTSMFVEIWLNVTIYCGVVQTTKCCLHVVFFIRLHFFKQLKMLHIL